MTEAMVVEAVRAAGGPDAFVASVDPVATGATLPAADPSAVERFESALAAGGPGAVQAADPIPFASEVAASWRSAQANNQGILRRIRALCEVKANGNVAAGELLELQYEVMNLAFQQEVVSKVADKSSNAIQTLVKNQ